MTDQLSKRYAQLGLALELFEIGDKMNACYQLGFIRHAISTDPVLSSDERKALEDRSAVLYKKFLGK